jgi:hypothetical protein
MLKVLCIVLLLSQNNYQAMFSISASEVFKVVLVNTPIVSPDDEERIMLIHNSLNEAKILPLYVTILVALLVIHLSTDNPIQGPFQTSEVINETKPIHLWENKAKELE